MYINSKNFKFIFFLIEKYLIFSNQSIYLQVLVESQLKVVFYKLEYNRNVNRLVLSNV